MSRIRLSDVIKCIRDVKGVGFLSEIVYLEYLLRGGLRRLFLPAGLRKTPCMPIASIIVRVKSRNDTLFFIPKKMGTIYFVLPTYEPITWNFIKSILRKGDVFIDVGAYVGTYSIPVAKLVAPTGKVFAIEPHPISFSLLQKNLELNNINNVVCINKAAYEKKGRERFTTEVIIPDSSHISPRGDLVVETDTLDGMVGDKISLVKCLKIDVEGAEIEVLKGASKTLERTEYVIVEVRKTTEEEVRQMLERKGFKYLRTFEVLEDKNNVKNLLFKNEGLV